MRVFNYSSHHGVTSWESQIQEILHFFAMLKIMKETGLSAECTIVMFFCQTDNHLQDHLFRSLASSAYSERLEAVSRYRFCIISISYSMMHAIMLELIKQE